MLPKNKRKLLVFVEKHCINSKQKMQLKKVNQNLLFLIRKFAHLQQSTIYGLLCSSTQWSERMVQKEVGFVNFVNFFNGKMTT